MIKFKEYNSGNENCTIEAEGPQKIAHECPTSLNEDGDVCRTLMNKKCKTCKDILKLENFYFNKTKNTLFSECKSCNKKRSTKWNKTNKQRYQENCINHKVDNPDLYVAYKMKEYAKNKHKYQEYSKLYRESDYGRGVKQALGRERQLKKTKATPKWLTQEHRELMKKFYINRPKGYHVDHIIPLKGKEVCGLHVPWNLQYLLASENLKKRNKFVS